MPARSSADCCGNREGRKFRSLMSSELWGVLHGIQFQKFRSKDIVFPSDQWFDSKGFQTSPPCFAGGVGSGRVGSGRVGSGLDSSPRSSRSKMACMTAGSVVFSMLPSSRSRAKEIF
jgi:hypothetical protein